MTSVFKSFHVYLYLPLCLCFLFSFRIKHENIVALEDIYESPNHLYLVMQLWVPLFAWWMSPGIVNLKAVVNPKSVHVTIEGQKNREWWCLWVLEKLAPLGDRGLCTGISPWGEVCKGLTAPSGCGITCYSTGCLYHFLMCQVQVLPLEDTPAGPLWRTSCSCL